MKTKAAYKMKVAFTGHFIKANCKIYTIYRKYKKNGTQLVVSEQGYGMDRRRRRDFSTIFYQPNPLILSILRSLSFLPQRKGNEATKYSITM